MADIVQSSVKIIAPESKYADETKKEAINEVLSLFIKGDRPDFAVSFAAEVDQNPRVRLGMIAEALGSEGDRLRSIILRFELGAQIASIELISVAKEYSQPNIATNLSSKELRYLYRIWQKVVNLIEVNDDAYGDLVNSLWDGVSLFLNKEWPNSIFDDTSLFFKLIAYGVSTFTPEQLKILRERLHEGCNAYIKDSLSLSARHGPRVGHFSTGMKILGNLISEGRMLQCSEESLVLLGWLEKDTRTDR